MPGHSLDTLAHDPKRVLGQVDQDRPRLRHGVLAQARRARGYGEGHVQPQPRLGTLGSAADHTHRVGAPELFHQPTLRELIARNLAHTHHRKHLICINGHRHTFTFFLSAGRACPRLIDLQVALLVKLRDFVRHADRPGAHPP